jgi:molecular chaperone DnaJ
MASRDYYEILGVSRGDSQDKIKKNFRARAAQLHPDNKDTGNESAFKELVEAYEVLSDEQKRSVYDRYGAEGLKGAGSMYSGFDMGSFSDLSEIFEYFFGGAMRTRTKRRGGVQDGADLKYDIEINFLEAVFGVEKTFSIKHLVHCSECKSTGAAPGARQMQCTTCHGQGQVRQTSSTFFGQFTQVMPCPTCDGAGTKIDRPCEECKGGGLLKKPKSIEVKIPPGVDTGVRLRVTGAGDQGKSGGRAGDLYVVIHVKEHAKFVREGSTIFIRQQIGFAMAALGGELLVDTVGGKKILKIPAGIQSGVTLIMKEEGVPFLNNPDKRGDQIVQVVVETPTKISAEEKQLLKRIAELRGEKLNVSKKDLNSQKNPSNSSDAQSSLFDAITGVFKSKNSTDEA